MKKIRKTLSVIIISFLLTAFGSQSLAYGDPIPPGSQELNQNSKAVLESLEVINAIGTLENPISLKMKGSGIVRGTAWFLLEDNHDQGIPMSFEMKDGELIANHVIYMEGIRGDYYLSHIDIIDSEGIGRTYYNSSRYTLEQFDARYKDDVYYAEAKDFADYNVQVTGVYGGYNPEVTIALENKDLKTNDILTISVGVDESDLKIDHVTVTYLLDGSDYYFQQRLERNPDGIFVGQRKISEYHKSGSYKLKYVYLSIGDNDEGMDITHSFEPQQYEAKQDLSNGFFTVSGTKEDNTPPEFISFKEKEMVAVLGEETNFELSIKEEVSQMNFGDVSFINEDGKQAFGVMSFEGDKGYIKIATPAEYIELGTYKIHRLVLEDNAGNRNLYFNSETNEYRDDLIMIDLSGYTVTFVNKEESKPLLSKIEIITLPETYYFQGEDLDLSKLVIEGLYDKGESKVLNITSENITGYNKDLVGQQTVTITYENIKTTFIVLVKDPKMKISISEEDGDTANVVIDKEDLAQIDIPEILDPSVKSVKIKLNIEILDENKMGTYINDMKDSSNMLALYDFNLVKIIENNDGSIIEKNLIDESFKGMLTLRIEVPEEYKDIENLVAVHVDEDGTVEELKTESKIIDGIRYLYFETNHFSIYGIAEVNVSVDEEQPVDPDGDEEITTPDVNQDEKEAADKTVTEEASLPNAGSVSNNLLNITGISLVLVGLLFLKRKKFAVEK